jgi:uncharacterized coiled-coil protein SlyX
MMIEKLLCLFPAYRELKRQTESDGNLIKSLERYIEALEGRDAERLNTIAGLETQCREGLQTVRELKQRLSGVLPDYKEEASP